MKSIVVNGYAYPTINQKLLKQISPDLTFVSFFSYTVRSDGTILPIQVEDLVSLLCDDQTGGLMVISTLTGNSGFDSDLAEEILSNTKTQELLTEKMLAVIKENHLVGVDFDFEYIRPQYADAYANWISKTRQRFNQEGYVVLTALAPKTSTNQKGLLYEGHKYKEVGEASNWVLLMTYEWGYTFGPPMAVAPLNKVREVIEYGLTQIPSCQILMGIPNYGYDWTLPYIKGESRAKSIGNVEAQEIAQREGALIQYDKVAQSPYFYYTDQQGRKHEVWFEDERSIRAKLGLVDEYDLAGVSYWNLMRPFPANWKVLNEMFCIAKLYTENLVVPNV